MDSIWWCHHVLKINIEKCGGEVDRAIMRRVGQLLELPSSREIPNQEFYKPHRILCRQNVSNSTQGQNTDRFIRTITMLWFSVLPSAYQRQSFRTHYGWSYEQAGMLLNLAAFWSGYGLFVVVVVVVLGSIALQAVVRDRRYA